MIKKILSVLTVVSMLQGPFVLFFPQVVTAICGSNKAAYDMAHLIRSDILQQRTRLACNSNLVAAAQARADGLANGEPWSHCDSNHVCSNDYARQYGCVLPDEYVGENGVESLAAGTGDPLEAFNSLLGGELHRNHVLGENDFYKTQTDIGVGFAANADSEHGFYFVVMIAKCLI